MIQETRDMIRLETDMAENELPQASESGEGTMRITGMQIGTYASFGTVICVGDNFAITLPTKNGHIVPGTAQVTYIGEEGS